MSGTSPKITDPFGREVAIGTKVKSRLEVFAHYATQNSFRDVPKGSVGTVLYPLGGSIDEFRVEFMIDDVVAQADYAAGQLEVIE